MEQICVRFHKPTEVLFMTKHVCVFLLAEFCKVT